MIMKTVFIYISGRNLTAFRHLIHRVWRPDVAAPGPHVAFGVGSVSPPGTRVTRYTNWTFKKRYMFGLDIHVVTGLLLLSG